MGSLDRLPVFCGEVTSEPRHARGFCISEAMKYLAALAILLALANYGAGGILTMGDQWCARHPGAPPSKCGPKPVTVWYQTQMMNGPPDDEHHIPAQAIVIPDPDE